MIKNITLTDFKTICRICLENRKDMCSVTTLNIITMIKECSSVHVSVEDQLPQQVCTWCVKRLENAFHLKQECETSDQKLRELIELKVEDNSNLDDIKLESLTDTIKIDDSSNLLVVEFNQDSCEIEQDFSETPLNLDVDNNQEPLLSDVEGDQSQKADFNEMIINSLGNSNQNRVENKLQKHVSSIHKKKKNNPFKLVSCNICRKKVQNRSLKRHQENWHDNSLFTCKECNAKFISKYRYQEHVDVVHKENFGCKCSVCDEEFQNPRQLKRHMVKHKQETVFTCDRCNKQFKTRLSLKAHINEEHSDESKFTCLVCKQIFFDNITLEKHTCAATNGNIKETTNNTNNRRKTENKKDTDERTTQYKCEKCAKTVYTTWRLALHMKTSHNAESIKCNKCDILFYHQLHFEEHLSQHDQPELICKNCGRYFETKRKLKHHEISHRPKQYRCLKCNAMFRDRFLLNKHEQFHSGDKPRKNCPICEKSISCAYPQIFKNHLKIHEARTPFACDECPKKFVKERTLQEHVVRVHKNEFLTDLLRKLCSICGKAFSGDYELNEHMQTHLGELKFSCSICNHYFVDNTAMENHMCTPKKDNIKETTNNKRKIEEEDSNETRTEYKCEKCAKIVYTTWRLALHTKQSHNTEPIKCNKCDILFYHQLHFEEHLTHHDEPELICKNCGRYFETKRKLKHHEISHRPKQFCCLKCNAVFRDRFLLNKHEQFHSSGKPRENCPICGKSISMAYPQLLKNHLKTHEDRKPFSCEECPKKFVKERTLQKHVMRVHKNEFLTDLLRKLCSICGKAFPADYELNEHMQTHSDEKPYQCNLCDKRFRQKKLLRKHVQRIHENRRPHCCKVCLKTFHTRTVLQAHMLLHTGERPHACFICNKSFGSKTSLKTHIKSHTGEKRGT